MHLNKTLQRFVAVTFAALLAILPLAGASAIDTEVLGLIFGGDLHLRAEPSTDAEILATYESGEHISITGEADEEGAWYAVETIDGKSGYMESAYIFPNSLGVIQNDDSYVNLRQRPSRDAIVLAEHGSGKLLTIISLEEDNWAYVQADDLEGYMDMEFISPAPYSLALNLSAAEGAATQSDPDDILDAGNTPVEEGEGYTGPIILDESTTFLVQVPMLGIDAADDALNAWAHSILTDAQEYMPEETDDTDASGENGFSLVVAYEVFRVADHYTSVVQTGEMNSPELANPKDLVFTVNVDRDSGSLLTYEDIFTKDALDTLYARISEKLQASNEDITAEMADPAAMDATWLKYTLLKPTGVSVILPAAEYLDNAMGRQTIVFTYDELEADGLLALNVNVTPTE